MEVIYLLLGLAALCPLALAGPVVTFTENPNIDVQKPNVGLSWNYCREPSSLVQINSATATPNPMPQGGLVEYSINVTVSETFSSPIKAELKMEWFFLNYWVKMTCYDNLGTCTFDDICTQLQIGTCPITKGNHMVKGSFYMRRSVGSSIYRVFVNLYHNGKWIACYRFNDSQVEVPRLR